jgi:hypothetical protein
VTTCTANWLRTLPNSPKITTLCELGDQGLFMAREALGAGLIDHVAYEDEIPALLESKVNPVHVITTEDYLHARRRMQRHCSF